MHYAAPREYRRVLEQALALALARETGTWRIRVTSRLVYLTPSSGSWWLQLRFMSPNGETFRTLLDPELLTPVVVAQAVADAMKTRR